jgi:hypothetical protein
MDKLGEHRCFGFLGQFIFYLGIILIISGFLWLDLMRYSGGEEIAV